MKRSLNAFFTLFLSLAAGAWAGPGEQIEVWKDSAGGSYLNGYLEYLPPTYDGTNRFPLVIFNHGLGESGTSAATVGKSDLQKVDDLAGSVPNNIKYNINNGISNINAIVISPQMTAWANLSRGFVDFVIGKYKVDTNRIYMTGLSMGGGTTWNFARENTNLLAAIVPVCGQPGGPPTGVQGMANLPIWAFHNTNDPVVDVQSTTIAWVSAIAACGGTPAPLMTIYNSALHNCWSTTYARQDMWDWMFAQNRAPAAPSRDSSTLLLYNFSENGGTTVTDLSGNGRDGTLGGFANTAAGAGVFGVSEGWVTGGGLSFLDDGVDCSYVDTPLSHATLLANGSFTIEFTASADGPSGGAPAVGKVPSFGPSMYFGFDQWGDRKLYMEIGDWPEQGETADLPWTVPGDGSDTTRHHIAIVYTKNGGGAGGTFEVFIDNASAGTWISSADLGVWDRNFCIGNTSVTATRDTAQQWDGIIYAVAFSDQALTPSSFVLGNPAVVLSASSLAENLAVGTTVGTLSTLGDTGPFTYTLVSGAGDTDNAYFQIVSNTLQTAARFDYEAKSSYSIRVRSVGVKTVTNVFAIAVTDVVEDYMMIVSADIEAMTRAVGTVRTSGDYPSASYVISGGADADKFEWASAGSPELQLKAPAVSGDVGKKYYVEVTATDSAPTPKSVKALIEATVVNSRSRAMILTIR